MSKSSSFKYKSEDQFYQTKQAAAVAHMTFTQYLLDAVLRRNREVLGLKDDEKK